MHLQVPKDHPTVGDPGLSLVEAQAHFSMWCMFSSPLYATHDVRLRDPEVEAIVLNPETIAINQDLMGEPARRVNVGVQPWRGDLGVDARVPQVIQWARALHNGDIALLVLNRGPDGSCESESCGRDVVVDTSNSSSSSSSKCKNSQTVSVTVHFADFLDGVPAGIYAVRDIQRRRDLGQFCKQVTIANMSVHETAFLRLRAVANSTTCTSPPPSPAPGPTPQSMCPGWPNRTSLRPCQSCPDSSKPCGFPVPPLPACPASYDEQPSGFWKDHKLEGSNVSVAACAQLCSLAATPSCVGFDVYDPMEVTEPASSGGSSCYLYSADATKGSKFTPDHRGLVRTCLLRSKEGSLVGQKG